MGEVIKKIIKKEKGRLFSVCLFLLGLAGLLFFCQIYFLNNKADNQPLPEIFSADPTDKDFYETAFGFEKKKVDFSTPPLAMIVPHHLLAADLIAEAFSNLKAEDYETVILISPNHFNVGEGKIISAGGNWETPYGILEADRKLFSELEKSGEISDEKEVFAGEHGIRAEVSFIKKILPEAEILPLVLKSSLSADEANNLGEILWRLSREKKILVILSADFSHYKNSVEAQADDKKTIEIINNFIFNKITEAEIDTRPGLLAVMRYAELSGASFKLLRNSNSALLVGRNDIEQTTSYITGYFQLNFEQGFLPIAADDEINLLFFGDLMLDRNVKNVIGTSSPEILLADLREKGVFAGRDLISANLEGAVVQNGEHWPPVNLYDFSFSPAAVGSLKNLGFDFFNLANNHLSDQGENGIIETEENLSDLGFSFSGCRDQMVGDCTTEIIERRGKKIGLAGASMVYGRFDENEFLRKISELASTTDLVIAQVHWGIEYEHYPAKNQTSLAYQIIAAGADLIIGHHPHVVGGAEIYKNKLIFYSLGNFVFDQYFSQDTQEELGVEILVGENFFQASLLPIVSRKSHLYLMEEEERNKFLDKMASWSSGDEEFKNKIREGIIKIEK